MKARLPQGYGKQSPNDLMRQAQEMQAAVQQKQQELEDAEYQGTSGGGMVEVTLKGDHQVLGLKIKPEAVDTEDLEMLEDLIAAAVNDAVRKIKETGEQEMEQISGGFSLPGIPGFIL
ncbi:MAG: YbaB/EbfC family nucleoid-associated protein [Oscillospiraceae bacterium]